VRRVPGRTDVYRLVGPFQIEVFDEPTPEVEPGWVVLKPLRAGICGSDLKLYTGARERSALMRKLPIALLHEAVAEVVALGDSSFELGQLVVPSPNIPCTVAHPDRYPRRDDACPACRPGGAGENYCTDGNFLSSDIDGMSRTTLVHPTECTIPVPDAAPDALAVLTEPLATVLAGLEHARADESSSFLVLGNGTIGILSAIVLHVVVGVPADRIVMTGHRWGSRGHVLQGLAIPTESEDLRGSDLAGRFDVAFECVGGAASGETLTVAIDMLRPGGRGIMFGPSEGAMLFDTRKMIAKGLTIVGCNRALPRHFVEALELVADPVVARLLERAIAPKEFDVRSARDLDDAMHYAWTKEDPGRAVTTWPR